MAKFVTTKEELKTAVADGETTIVIKGKLAKRLKPLVKVSGLKGKMIPMTQGAAVGALGLTGISTAVAITLIVTVGLVTMVAILKGYTIRYKNVDGDEIILES